MGVDAVDDVNDRLDLSWGQRGVDGAAESGERERGEERELHGRCDSVQKLDNGSRIQKMDGDCGLRAETRGSRAKNANEQRTVSLDLYSVQLKF